MLQNNLNTYPKGVSIAICCYNSARIIENCLKAILKQDFKGKWELIIADNNSTDGTADVARKVLENSGCDYRIITVKQQGVLYARLTCMREAKYSYLQFSDDDNLLCPNYVSRMYEFMETHPEVGACGGRGVAQFQTEPPAYIKDAEFCYAIGSQKQNANNGFLFGAGMCLRTEVVRYMAEHHHFYLAGRSGKFLLAGEDSEIAYMVQLYGYKLDGLDDIFYTHVLATRRLNREYLHKMVEGFGISNPVLCVFQLILRHKPFLLVIKAMLSTLKILLKHYLYGYRHADENAKSYICMQNGAMKGFRHFGLCGLYKIYRNLKKEISLVE